MAHDHDVSRLGDRRRASEVHQPLRAVPGHERQIHIGRLPRGGRLTAKVVEMAVHEGQPDSPEPFLGGGERPTRIVQSPPATSGFSPWAKRAASVEWISEQDLRICSNPITPVRASRFGSSTGSTSPASRALVLARALRP